jgi:hypothetical protein
MVQVKRNRDIQTWQPDHKGNNKYTRIGMVVLTNDTETKFDSLLESQGVS